jgi:hypothetical protein
VSLTFQSNISLDTCGHLNRGCFYINPGSFVSNGITFGSGKLSDMKAVVAAILLDQEATASTLDADPTYGGIKEPIIKVLHFLRSMKYQKTAWDRCVKNHVFSWILFFSDLTDPCFLHRNIYPKLSEMCAKVGQMVSPLTVSRH